MLRAVPQLNVQISKVLYPRGVFYLQTRRAPQSRTFFEHLNFQSWLEAAAFLAFSLLTPASRNNGVQFLISHPATWLPTEAVASFFDLQEPQNIGTTQRFGTFLSFRAFDLLSTDSFSSLTSSLLTLSLLWLFPSLLFHLPILSEV